MKMSVWLLLRHWDKSVKMKICIFAFRSFLGLSKPYKMIIKEFGETPQNPLGE